MSTCMCGKPADTYGGLCDRCASLQMLGLGTHASAVEIENTYQTLVQVWHPDRFPNDPKMRLAAEGKLKEINAAHDYLTSGDPAEKPRPAVRASEPVAEPEEPPVADEIPEQPQEDEPEEVRRIMKRLNRGSGSKTLFRVTLAFGGITALGLLCVSIDFFLSANPNTAGPWDELKAEVSRDIHANLLRMSTNDKDNMSGSKTETATPPAASATQSDTQAHGSAAKAEASTQPRQVTAAREVHGAKPYITSGLTPMEVLSILGNPTSSTGEKMFYKGSEIDFKNGHLAGWKIDEKTAPIRVKLWPDSPPVPGLLTFAVGSSKSDVIAVQGTPSLFSDNEFGYGGAVVFFKNDHVVGWKEDPASVRLRVAH